MGKDRQERKLRESRRVESDTRINHYNIQVQLDLIHQNRLENKTSTIYAKDGFDIVRNRLYIISLMFSIYIEIIFCTLYPPITFIFTYSY